MLGSFWVAAQLASSQEGLSSMGEWVIINVTSADPKIEENYFRYNFVYYNYMNLEVHFCVIFISSLTWNSHFADRESLFQIHKYTVFPRLQSSRSKKHVTHLNTCAYGAGWLSGNACYLHWEGGQVESGAGNHPGWGCQWFSSLPPSKFQDGTPTGLRPLQSDINLLV
jgi:hypothetical protein